ncbi:response regulator transcription factor [Flavobacterium sedimenticola]|uniref:LuxR C-terminal-related transcriptional regulator n=1 Tax=Flavobacterium sedimenticola TaxID=3043286 RepID=A0ABT6XPI7_9FLAO|nr:LuxR C-terminal-related transcriptional regulator [Flavobacterium sedimenticola]MDI9256897.1 LuxR C-terminal-related transcriptional regulator [Flavobacterium sedimenticola]
MLKLKPYKEILSYLGAMVVILVLLRWFEYRFIVLENQYEIYIGIIAVFFLFFGIWLSQKLINPKEKTIIVEKEIRISSSDFILNQTELARRNISKRELEVLRLMAQGMSNQEIAEQLFVSRNTVKTHSAKLFEKLDVKRRTQAVEKAKKLQLLPPTLA